MHSTAYRSYLSKSKKKLPLLIWNRRATGRIPPAAIYPNWMPRNTSSSLVSAEDRSLSALVKLRSGEDWEAL